MVGCGSVVTMVLWLRRQFGVCGGDYWVVIFWVVVDFFFKVVVVFPIWYFFKVGVSDLVLVGYGFFFFLNCILGCGGCGVCVVVAVGWWQLCGGCSSGFP